MKPCVKLITLWQGVLPEWFPQFRERMAANRMVDWELIDRLPVASPKRDAYALCDLRPLYGELLADKFKGYEWWGWCDLDIVVGNLDKLLPGLMDGADIVSTDGQAIHGPLTILRNTPQVCGLWRTVRGVEEVLADPDYCNFDETGFNRPGCPPNGNPNFTDAVRSSGLWVRWDDRSWTETADELRNTDEVAPSRSCEMWNLANDLVELPTCRDILLYHFTAKPKRWPLPDRWGHRRVEQLERLNAVPAQRPPPEIESPEFWADRLMSALVNGRPIHTVVYDTGEEEWARIQRHSAEVIFAYIKPDEKVLDAGCGHGALLECFGSIPTIMVMDAYVGVDSASALVNFAKKRHLGFRFSVGNLRCLDFPDDAFDWAVCRGVEGSVRTVSGNRGWKLMEREMLRVAKRLLVIDLACNHRIVERS